MLHPEASFSIESTSTDGADHKNKIVTSSVVATLQQTGIVHANNSESQKGNRDTAVPPQENGTPSLAH